MLNINTLIYSPQEFCELSSITPILWMRRLRPEECDFSILVNMRFRLEMYLSLAPLAGAITVQRSCCAISPPADPSPDPSLPWLHSALLHEQRSMF